MAATVVPASKSVYGTWDVREVKNEKLAPGTEVIASDRSYKVAADGSWRIWPPQVKGKAAVKRWRRERRHGGGR